MNVYVTRAASPRAARRAADDVLECLKNVQFISDAPPFHSGRPSAIVSLEATCCPLTPFHAAPSHHPMYKLFSSYSIHI